MKPIRKLCVLLAAFVMTACAGLQTKPPENVTARCNEQPSWTSVDAKGNPFAIYVCFGEKNNLLYTARYVQAPPPPQTPEQVLEAKRAAGRALAQPSATAQ